MEKMEFAEMVQEYGRLFKWHDKTQSGYYDEAGDWVPPHVVDKTTIGVFLPFTDDDLRYSEAGTYSTKDRKLYTLDELEEGIKIEYKGIPYTVQGFKDYTDYADVFIYVARWTGNA